MSGIDEVVAVARRVAAASPSLAADVAAVRDRLARPLRVAIAGRTKAGKSTLLNALVGERLAATDATECTRIVTWYRYDLGYSVTARLRSGESRSLEFERSAGSLQIRLGGLGVAEVDRLEIGWPSSRLAHLTLIDTPGLDSGTPGSSERTIAALVGEDSGSGEADAVVYLMRHLHRKDAEFLEAFDQPMATASPVNAVALLSRADEVGGGWGGALQSADAIAARYAADPRVTSLVLTVLPLSGLLAETGASLREEEVAAVRQIASLDGAGRAALLLSVDRFRNRPENPLGPEVRERLLRRFGLFGLRFAVDALVASPALSGPELARRLVEASGIRSLETLVRRQFTDRADALKARSALTELRQIAERARRERLPGAQDLAAALERFEAGSRELAELRVLHLAHVGAAGLDDAERAEVDRVLDGSSLAERLAQPIGTGPAGLARVALEGVERWRTRASNPLADRQAIEVAETVARTYEAMVQQLRQAEAGARSRG